MREMDRWLGDGGMALIGHLGAAFTAYGDGWSEATWEPTATCCNPAGTVQAGVYAVVLDAAMNFALSAALDAGEYGTTLEMNVSTMRAARAGDRLTVRGEVLRLGRRIAFLQAVVGAAVPEGEPTDPAGIARATGTFVVYRDGSPAG